MLCNRARAKGYNKSYKAVVRFKIIMGIYSNHGLEYFVVLNGSVDHDALKDLLDSIYTRYNHRVVLCPGNKLCVLSTGKTDDRLAASYYYYVKGKDGWFGREAYYSEWCRPVEDQSEVDIELSAEENMILECIREGFKGQVEFEGWFDVNKIGCSY